MPQKCSISAASVLYLFKSAAFHFQSIVSSFHVHIFKCFDSKRSPRSQIVPTRVQICSTLAQNICLYSDTNDATQMSCFFSFESFSCFCTLMKLLLNEINDQMKQNENSPNNTMQRTTLTWSLGTASLQDAFALLLTVPLSLILIWPLKFPCLLWGGYEAGSIKPLQCVDLWFLSVGELLKPRFLWKHIYQQH